MHRIALVFAVFLATCIAAAADNCPSRRITVIVPDRSALMSDLPSVSEQGLDFKGLSAWTGPFAPKGTPQDGPALYDALVAQR